jgi:hypothetical protein
LELILSDNEKINRIVVRVAKYIDRLKIYTIEGRSIKTGGNGGSTCDPPNLNELISISGRTTKYVNQFYVFNHHIYQLMDYLPSFGFNCQNELSASKLH